MKHIVEMSDVISAVNEFVEDIRTNGDGATVTMKIEYADLLDAIQDEYDCGADGTVLEVLRDLNDSVGLDEFGISIVSG